MAISAVQGSFTGIGQTSNPFTSQPQSGQIGQDKDGDGKAGGSGKAHHGHHGHRGHKTQQPTTPQTVSAATTANASSQQVSAAPTDGSTPTAADPSVTSFTGVGGTLDTVA